MGRTVISAEDLRELIREEAARHEACAGVHFSGVEPQEPDASGCNWTLAGVRGSGDSAATATCVQALTAAVEGLQSRYNLPLTR